MSKPWECPRCHRINAPSMPFCGCPPHPEASFDVETFRKELTTHLDDKKLIENMCLSYRHDFGLMTPEEQQALRFEAREWLRAYRNNTTD